MFCTRSWRPRYSWSMRRVVWVQFIRHLSAVVDEYGTNPYSCISQCDDPTFHPELVPFGSHQIILPLLRVQMLRECGSKSSQTSLLGNSEHGQQYRPYPPFVFPATGRTKRAPQLKSPNLLCLERKSSTLCMAEATLNYPPTRPIS